MCLPHLDTTSSEQGQLHFLHFRCKNNHRFPPVLNCCLQFTMPNYARYKKQVRHCSVPGTQSYRAGLNKQAFHCCLYLTILIMCVFGNRRCLVIEKYCPFTSFRPCKARLDMNCALCVFMFWVLLHILLSGCVLLDRSPMCFLGHVFLTNKSVIFQESWQLNVCRRKYNDRQRQVWMNFTLYSLDLMNFL